MVSFLFKFQKEDTQLHHLNAVKKQKQKKLAVPKFSLTQGIPIKRLTRNTYKIPKNTTASIRKQVKT
jgi:hypothetical protein